MVGVQFLTVQREHGAARGRGRGPLELRGDYVITVLHPFRPRPKSFRGVGLRRL